MSSVVPIATPAVASGDDYVDSLALDAQFALVVDRLNTLIAAMGRVRDETNQLADGAVRWRMFSTRAKQVLTDLVTNLGLLYQRAGEERWTTLPVPDGEAYTAGTEPGFAGGFDAEPPSNSWSIVMPGATGASYRLRLRVRHFAAGDPISTVEMALSGSRSQTWTLNPSPGEAVDRTITTRVYAGDVVTFTFVAGTEFAVDTDMPDPEIGGRFPYRPRYRACGAFQFDWLSYIQRSGEAILITSDGQDIVTSDDSYVGVDLP